MHKLRRMLLSASTTAWLVMFKILFDWHFGILGIIAMALIVYPATMLIRKPTDQIAEACCVQRNSDTKFATFPVMMAMNYTPTEVGGFWEHEVVFRMLHQYSEYLTYRTPFFYQG